MQVFDEKDMLWQNSTTCKDLVALVQDLLSTNVVKKVLCFGLGDFAAPPLKGKKNSLTLGMKPQT
jgi:hypothetical protein